MSTQPSITNGRVVTLGMFIVDRFERLSKDPLDVAEDHVEQLGGAGTYFSIGARIFLSPHQIGQIINHNPAETFGEILDKLRAYDVAHGEESMWYFQKSKHTSMIVNTYEGEKRVERFLARSPQIWPEDIIRSTLRSSCFASRGDQTIPPRADTSLPQYLHFCTSPARARIIIDQIEAIRSHGITPRSSSDPTLGKDWSPGLLWECYPPESIPANLEIIKRTTRRVLISSPNHHEALAVFGLIAEDGKGREAALVEQVERATREMVRWLYDTSSDVVDPSVTSADHLESPVKGPWPSSARAIIVRCGPLGACIGQIRDPSSNKWTSPEEVKITWIEAYWREAVHPEAPCRIKDVTGGGNAFEGGLAAGLKLTEGNVIEASLYASVASSFAIEQGGMPMITTHAQPDDRHLERWNGESPLDRLEELRARLKASGGRAVLPS